MPDSPSSPESSSARHYRGPGTVFLAVCLFLVIWGVKIGIVDRYGSDLPNWDQWDAEGRFLFLPYLRGELTIADLFRPHNEHRILMTRLLSLGLLVANGQWDSKLECVANAALHALIAVMWFVMGSRLLSGRWRLVWLATVAVLVAPPHSWHNVISGFHSQQYFLLGMSTLAIVTLVISRPGSLGWWGGAACAILSLFTMASGLLAAAAIIITFGLMGLRHRRLILDQWPTLLVCGLVVAAGLWLHQPMLGHAPLKASSVSEMLLTFWRHIQWPVVMQPLFPVLAGLPFLGLVAALLRNDHKPDRREVAIVATGTWVLLQYAATSYARGAGAPFPAPRYLDTNLAGIGVLALSALVLLTRHPTSQKHRTPRSFAFCLWALATALGLWVQLSNVVHHDLPYAHAELMEREESTQAYIWTGDPGYLIDRPIPYPDAANLMSRLEPKEIQAILPASVRAPLELAGTANPPDSFKRGGVPDELKSASPQRHWGSFSTSGASGAGTWESAPLTADPSHWLKISIAGRAQADANPLSMVVVSLAGRTEHRFFATGLPQDKWHSVYVRPTGGEIEIKATDADVDGWIAFSPPVEVASLSFWSGRIAHYGFGIAVCGLAASGLGVAAAARRKERISPS